MRRFSLRFLLLLIKVAAVHIAYLVGAGAGGAGGAGAVGAGAVGAGAGAGIVPGGRKIISMSALKALT